MGEEVKTVKIMKTKSFSTLNEMAQFVNTNRIGKEDLVTVLFHEEMWRVIYYEYGRG